MDENSDGLGIKLENFIRENYRSASSGINVLVRSKNFNFTYWAGEISDLNFKYLRDTMYDMASLTKPVVTATLVMKMVESGKLGLEDTLESLGIYGQEYTAGKLTIKELITHSSGLIPTYPLYKNGKSREDYLRTIALMHERRQYPIVEEYSDLNFILLGLILERISGKSLDRLAQELVFNPLSMKNSTFNPVQETSRIAPTEKDPERGGLVWGKVHDEKSYYLGGVAGHAGLFSTMDDMAIFAEALLSGKVVRKRTLKAMITPQNIHIGGMFGLGWMIKVPRPANPSPSFGYSGFMGDIAPYGTFGHTGFTGTSICLEPETGTFVIILTNRVYPSRESLGILRFRRLFHNLVFSLLS